MLPKVKNKGKHRKFTSADLPNKQTKQEKLHLKKNSINPEQNNSIDENYMNRIVDVKQGFQLTMFKKNMKEI